MKKENTKQSTKSNNESTYSQLNLDIELLSADDLAKCAAGIHDRSTDDIDFPNFPVNFPKNF